MPNPSKNKGNTYERELVNQAKELGLPAQRAYASDGRAFGRCKEVDCLIGGYAVQAKRTHAVAKKLIPTEGVDCVATRPDHGDTLIIMRWNDWLDLLMHIRELEKKKGKG